LIVGSGKDVFSITASWLGRTCKMPRCRHADACARFHQVCGNQAEAAALERLTMTIVKRPKDTSTLVQVLVVMTHSRRRTIVCVKVYSQWIRHGTARHGTVRYGAAPRPFQTKSGVVRHRSRSGVKEPYDTISSTSGHRSSSPMVRLIRKIRLPISVLRRLQVSMEPLSR